MRSDLVLAPDPELGAGERTRRITTVRTGGRASTHAQVIDAPVGEGHVVMFGIRPFWRWQTQGTFFMGFNAILNWNDLDAGRGGAGDRSASGGPRCSSSR